MYDLPTPELGAVITAVLILLIPAALAALGAQGLSQVEDGAGGLIRGASLLALTLTLPTLFVSLVSAWGVLWPTHPFASPAPTGGMDAELVGAAASVALAAAAAAAGAFIAVRRRTSR